MQFSVPLVQAQVAIQLRSLRILEVKEFILFYFIYLYLKRTAHLAINASLPCVPLKHIYIYTQVKHMIKHRIYQV